jgi:hypothetical protein
MAVTTVLLTADLERKVKEKCDGLQMKALHPGIVATMALDLWSKDLWNPGEDAEGTKNVRLFLYLGDDAYEAALRKRGVTNVSISSVVRRALQDWVDGRWELGLIRA